VIVNPLLSPKADAIAAELVKSQRRQDAAGIAAVSEPLPGPSLQAFMPDSIEVAMAGGNTAEVRPLYDCDLEWLAKAEHPLHTIMQSRDSKEVFRPSGVPAWQICWLLTRDVEAADDYLLANGVAAMTAQARREFGRLQSRDLVALCSACVTQLENYWAPTLKYEPAAMEDEQRANPPSQGPSSGPQLTGSDG
jgi:hypothetical protein